MGFRYNPNPDAPNPIKHMHATKLGELPDPRDALKSAALRLTKHINMGNGNVGIGQRVHKLIQETRSALPADITIPDSPVEQLKMGIREGLITFGQVDRILSQTATKNHPARQIAPYVKTDLSKVPPNVQI